MKETDATEFWALVEQLGHKRLAGYVREAEIAGHGFIRVDVPAAEGEPGPWAATQFLSPASIYAITPITEELARRMAQTCKPEPVTRWELPPADVMRRDPADDRPEDDDVDDLDDEGDPL